MFKKILVCLDGSSFSEQVLRFVSEEATAASKKLVLLHVANTATMLPEPDQVAAEKAKAKTYLNKKAGVLKEMGIDTECVVIVGDPGPTIVDYAEKSDIDLIAIATHGRSGITRMIFGSVAEYVIRNSKLPILLIRSK
jgi:nucleotide-binding universal stress UspA family protein